LPDPRGAFIRVLDGGKGLDPNRVLGSFQENSFKEHQHFIARNIGSTSSLTNTSYLTQNSNNTQGNNDYSLRGGSDEANIGLTSSVGSSETRPDNYAFILAIKAYGTLVKPGELDLNGLAQDVLNNANAIAEKGEETVLWSGGASGGTVTLNDDINNYRQLEFIIGTSSDIDFMNISVSSFSSTSSSRQALRTLSSASTTANIRFHYETDTSVTVPSSVGGIILMKVKGIK